MKSYFSTDFFAGNRKRLRELVKSDVPIVITAAGQLQKSGDTTFPFQQDANFWYMTGINEPDVVLVIDNDQEYLIIRELSDYQNIFDGRLSPTELTIRSGIKTILPTKDGWKLLKARLKTSERAATLAANPAYIGTYGMYANPARSRLMRRLRQAKPGLQIDYLGQEFAKLRVVKQRIEVEAIQAAIDLTTEALEIVKKSLSKLNYEYEIEAIITNHFLQSGADNTWKPIVAAGPNACLIHYLANADTLNKNDLVLIDIGAFLENYTSDISRTLSIGGKPTVRQKQVYDAVKETQEFAFGQIKPGISYKECELRVREYTGVKLKELGLIKDSRDKESIAKYYPHAPHYLGLDVHDVGDYTVPLVPGMVLTVEPGIYIPEEGIGVRIEDDILITEDGHEILSRKLPRDLI